MIRKLIERMELIQIGRNWLILIVLMLMLTGCPPAAFDYSYQVFYRNETSDTILLIFGKDNANYNVDSLLITPMQDTCIEGLIGVYEDEDPLAQLLNQSWWQIMDQVRVYRHDSLKVTWVGPGRYMPDSIHHFYNYNSWDSWLLDKTNKYGANGIVMFTITEEDFVKN